MQSIKVIGEVHQHHQLVATVPDSIAPGPVEVVILPLSAEDDAGQNWMAGLAAQWEDELADPRQDIYSLSDGVPVDGPR
ncbi:MAG TPA: hypothetical protein VMP01_10155 [Pirellulaceae bacterium]|nr:hypothetical protein [Pirellulaceae bacterium]